MPRGPRRNLRPVAESMSQPISPTSTGICPTDWQASSSSGTPAARQAAPTAAAGWTSPPWLGTCTSETSFTRSSSIAVEAVDVDLAVLVVGHDDDGGAGAVGDLAHRDVVAGVLGVGGEDAVARAAARSE